MEKDHISEVGTVCMEKMEVAFLPFEYTGDQKTTDDKIAEILEMAGDMACGDPFILIDWGKRSMDGYAAEACCPVSGNIGKMSREFAGGDAYVLVYRGDYDGLDKGYQKIFKFAYDRGVQPGMEFLEIHRGSNGGEREIELIMMIHPWTQLMMDSLMDVLGEEDSKELVEELVDIGPLTEIDDRYSTIQWLIEDLEGLTDEDQRYEIMSRCADRFSEERIDEMREVYERKNDVDDVLEFMRKEQDWYSEPWREGNEIHIIKVPYRRKGYENANTPDEKRKFYCHCPLVRDRLNDGMPSTYCLCGTGWFRQQWEGILGRPIKVRLARSLLKGDDCCEFVIELQ